MNRDAAALDAEIRRLMGRRNELDRQSAVPANRLRAETTVDHGRTFTRFYGDAAATWGPFMPPVRNRITGFK